MEYTMTMRTEVNWIIVWAFGGVLSKQQVSIKGTRFPESLSIDQFLIWDSVAWGQLGTN
jgi:hypothetical protein